MPKSATIEIIKDNNCPYCKGENNHSRNQRDQCKKKKAGNGATPKNDKKK